MGATLPRYEVERGNEGGDVVEVPTKDEFDALVDRVNAIAAQVGGGVGAATAIAHSDPDTPYPSAS